MNIPGSKKIYPFYIEAAANADTVEVYEAPIDAMSGASLKIMQHTGNWRSVHYLALGGTDYAALDAFLTYYPNITHIVLCLDNDEAVEPERGHYKHLEAAAKPWKTDRRLSARIITTRWCRLRGNTKALYQLGDILEETR